MNDKTYQCECGKQFDNPQSFNAHKSNCKIHYSIKGTDLTEVYQKRVNSRKATIQKAKEEKQKLALDSWVKEKHHCERCGALMTEKFGSGRFCSRSCANGHSVSDEQRVKTSNSLTGSSLSIEEYREKKTSQTIHHTYQCDVCKRMFSHKGYLAHYNRCCKKHGMPVMAKVGKDTLDVTENSLADYLRANTQCEICGKTADESITYTGKWHSNRLCADHDHSNNHFRGVLCQACNRQLGWYEKYQQQINTYLSK